MDRLRKTLVVLSITTYILISVGGLVRASGAGLGCPDWPLCFGRLIPPFSAADVPNDPAHPEWQTLFNPALAWTEYLNRLYGIIVGCIAIYAVVLACLHRRRISQRLYRTCIAILALFILQGGLGGLVVLAHLDAFKITVHFLAAILIACVLLYANVLSFDDRFLRHTKPLAPALGRARILLRVGFILTLIQVFMGTRVRTAIDEAFGKGKAPDEIASGTPRTEWLQAVPQIDIPHRQLGALTFLVLLIIVAYVWRQAASGHRPLQRALQVVAASAVLQVGSGLVLAYLGFPAWSMVVHLSVATWLLGALFLADLLVVRSPHAASTPRRATA